MNWYNQFSWQKEQLSNQHFSLPYQENHQGFARISSSSDIWWSTEAELNPNFCI